MRGVMTVVSMNSALLRDLRERYGKRAVPVTPEDAEEIVKAYEKIFQRELKELFDERWKRAVIRVYKPGAGMNEDLWETSNVSQVQASRSN